MFKTCQGTTHSIRALSTGLMIAVSTSVIGVSTAHAQGGSCAQGQKFLQQRQAIIAQINGWAKKKVDPNTACSVFGRLQNNGAATISWMQTNKDWCQIPEDALNNLTSSQGQIVKNRNAACQAAAQFNKMKKEAMKQAQQRAQQQQQSGGNSAFSGADDVTGGARPIPRSPL